MKGWMNVGIEGGLGKNFSVQRKKMGEKKRKEKKLKKECNMFVYLLYMQEIIFGLCRNAA